MKFSIIGYIRGTIYLLIGLHFFTAIWLYIMQPSNYQDYSDYLHYLVFTAVVLFLLGAAFVIMSIYFFRSKKCIENKNLGLIISINIIFNILLLIHLVRLPENCIFISKTYAQQMSAWEWIIESIIFAIGLCYNVCGLCCVVLNKIKDKSKERNRLLLFLYKAFTFAGVFTGILGPLAYVLWVWANVYVFTVPIALSIIVLNAICMLVLSHYIKKSSNKLWAIMHIVLSTLNGICMLFVVPTGFLNNRLIAFSAATLFLAVAGSFALLYIHKQSMDKNKPTSQKVR